MRKQCFELVEKSKSKYKKNFHFMIDFITLEKKHLPMLLDWRTRPDSNKIFKY